MYLHSLFILCMCSLLCSNVYVFKYEYDNVCMDTEIDDKLLELPCFGLFKLIYIAPLQ